jgi:mRNA-degrading endonuclease RelE of RelBE toxin-antitoxin system
MNFRIADTFTASLARLTGEEQKAAKTTAFDLQLNPANPGMQLHKLEKAKDKHFWSVRVSGDIRLIVHKTESSFLLCYVDHHDAAYRWAERRRIETHPVTGAAQLVEVRERVEVVSVRKPAPTKKAPALSPLFAHRTDDELLGYGLPQDWLEAVRSVTEPELLALVERLPAEAGEALLDLAIGKTPATAAAPAGADPFAHPDAQRRFRIMDNVEELERALEYPWDKWAVFLHPAQRQYVERAYNGPVRISGSAGTGKTIVALHRAVFLARRFPEARVLLTTLSKALASALEHKLRLLAGNEPGVMARVAVRSVEAVAYEAHTVAFGAPNLATEAALRTLLAETTKEVEGARFPANFVYSEWAEVVDPWHLETWEDYRDVRRLGRKTKVGGKQREALWSIFAAVLGKLGERKLTTWPRIYHRLARHYGEGNPCPWQFVVADESQDLGVAELRFLAALGAAAEGGLFFTGDLGQRIFQQPYSWKSLGVDVRGRSHTLRINYRTSHQIRLQADRLLPPSVSDVDGNEEARTGTLSVFNGPAPDVLTFKDAIAESFAVGGWITSLLAEGYLPHEIGVIVREHAQRARAVDAVKAAGCKAQNLGEKSEPMPGQVSVGTMHLAKGLEFRAVAVMACDDEVIPLQDRIEAVTDDADLEEVYNTERHLLYVACTRARDRLMVSGVDPASEFLGDLRGK